MEERKLNLNTPLMSVRRNSTKASSNSGKKRISVDSLPNKRHTVPLSNVDYKLEQEQVTEPVAVPFMWEQIPGKAKDGSESGVDTPEETSSTPRMALGMVLDIRRKSFQRESDDKAGINQDVSTELAIWLKTSRGENNEKGEAFMQSDRDEDEGDVYSDAVETLSPTESMTFSFNYSVSGLSGSEGPTVKPSGTFSVDPQTRDFMMKRFLPAARAMAVEPPQYTPKKQLVVDEQPQYTPQKQLVVVDQPKKANERVPTKDSRSALKQYSSEIVQHFTQQDKFDEESEDEDDDHDDFRTLTTKGCGLLPRLCLKSPLDLLNSVHDAKCKMRSSTPCIPRVRTPGRDAKVRSQSQPKERIGSEVGSPKLRAMENKPPNRSTSPLARSNRFNYSGELQQKGRLSPFRRTGNDGLSYPRIVGPVSRSGEIGHLSLPSLHPVRTSKNLSGELQTKGRLSPFRRAGNDGLSYPRCIGPVSRSGEIGHLGLPKLDTIRTSKNLLAVGASNFERTSFPQRAKQCSGSSSPVVEKTLYVDTVNTARKSCSSVKSPRQEGWTDAAGGEEGFKSRGSEKISKRVSSFQDINCLDTSNAKSSTNPRSIVSVDAKDPSREDQRFDEEFKSLVCMGTRNRIEDSKICNRTIEEDENKKIIPIETPLPPPLLKSPSESWLFRALPSISTKNSSNFSNSLYNKKQDSKVAPNSTKWETIVKSSKLHHDHIRYSEELITHSSQRPGS